MTLPRLPIVGLFVVAVSVVAASPAAAQTGKVLGPNKCVNCHEHEREKLWASGGEATKVRELFPDRGFQAGHINSLKQLESPKAAGFAKAIGLADVYDPKGRCVTCHAVDLDATNGVSCESCHGPAGGYVDLHQTKGAYRQAVGAGMLDTVGRPQVWAQQCLSCHVKNLPAAMVAAGHPSGEKFDLAQKFVPVSLHFRSSKYTQAQMADIWASVSPSNRPAPPPPSPTPAPLPPAPSPAPNKPLTTAPPSPPKAEESKTTIPSPPPAGPATTTGTTTNPPRPPSFEEVLVPTPGRTVSRANPAMSLAALQGRLVAALATLLESDRAVALPLDSALRPAPYRGPDAGLLDLQAEAISLALQVLGKKPVKSPGKN